MGAFALFDAERRKLQENAVPAQPERVLLTITEQEAYEMAAHHLAERELKFTSWWEHERAKVDSHEVDELKQNVADELSGVFANHKR